MTDPLPADVREYLGFMSDGFDMKSQRARELLAKYPKPQPEPAWQPGDAVIDGGRLLVSGRGRWYDAVSMMTYDALSPGYEPVYVAGRRVHPARFHDHAETLRELAEDNFNDPTAVEVQRIADDIDPEVPDGS